MKKIIPIHGSDNHQPGAFLGCYYTGRILKRLDRPDATPFSLSRPVFLRHSAGGVEVADRLQA